MNKQNKVNEREEEVRITIVTVELKFKIKKLKVKNLYRYIIDSYQIENKAISMMHWKSPRSDVEI